MTARLTLNVPPTRPELEALLEAAKKLPPMTAAQIREQRRSWVRGEMLLEHPEMTAEQVDRIMDEIEGKP